ncbi:2-hydroxymuconate tautomerase [Arthrobacter sp. RAF14]|uniref:2-hydroxymuconate tautomerase n=1 Tax=Arthrobacter sp. RAF14 TaxID=3233051 RepID=UPI003F90404F
MPIVNIAIVPDLMSGDRAEQYKQIAEGVTEVLASSTGAPNESVHVLIDEVTYDKYAVGGAMLEERMQTSDRTDTRALDRLQRE